MNAKGIFVNDLHTSVTIGFPRPGLAKISGHFVPEEIDKIQNILILVVQTVAKRRNEMEMKLIINQSQGQSPLILEKHVSAADGSDEESREVQQQAQPQIRAMLSDSDESDDVEIQDMIMQRRKA